MNITPTKLSPGKFLPPGQLRLIPVRMLLPGMLILGSITSFALNTNYPPEEYPETNPCSCCDSSPGVGSVQSPSSMGGDWSLGFVRPSSGADNRKHVVKLDYWTADVTVDSFDPSILQIDEPQNAEIMRESGSLRQVMTSNGFAAIAPLASGTGFTITFYNSSDIQSKSGEFYVIPTSAVPLNTVEISRADTGETPSKMKVLVTENYTGVPKSKLYTYERTAGDPGDPDSPLTHIFRFYDGNSEDPAQLWQEVETIHTQVSGGAEAGEYELSRIERERKLNGNMADVDKSWKRIAVNKSGSPVVLKEYRGVTSDPGGNPAPSIRGVIKPYFTDGANPTSYNRVSRVDYVPGGDWATYTYQELPLSGIRRTSVIRPWSDGAVNQETVAIEALQTTSDSGETLTIDGQVVSSRMTSRLDKGSSIVLENTTTLTAAGGVPTLLWRHANRSPVEMYRRGRPQKIHHPDGTREFFNYNLENGNELVIVHRKGEFDGTAIIRGIHSETRENLTTGQIVQEARYAIEGSQKYLLEKREATEFTRTGVPTKWIYNDNSNDYTMETRDCCQVAESRSRDGIVTSYLYDGLGRRIYEEALEIETHTYYDGLETTVKRKPTGGTEVMASRTVRNFAGEMVTSYQPAPVTGETGTSFTHNHAERKHTTTRSFDDATTITETYLDGQTKNVTGTATNPVRYDYALHQQDGGGIMTTTTALDDSGADTAEVTIRYSGRNGETLMIKTPDDDSDADSLPQITSYTYETGTGHLTSVSDPDGVTTFHQYNALGERYRSILDLDGDNLAETDVDQVSETTRVYDPATAAWKTTTAVAAGNDATLTTVSTSWSKPDGTWSKSTTVGVTGATIFNGPSMLDRVDGAWTETATLPDASLRIRTYTGHLLTGEKTRVTASGNVLGETTYDYDDFRRLDTVIHPLLGETRLNDPATGLLKTVTTVSGRVTNYGYDELGRLDTVTLPGSTESHPLVQHTTYTLKDQPEKSWGSQTNPSSRAYDSQGRLRTLTTYQSGITSEAGFASATGATTTWFHYPSTGLLSSKEDAENKGATYTYTPAGRLKTRTWQRGVTTTYDHDLAGRLETVTYTDDTPSVYYFLDRLGRVDLLRQGAAASPGFREWDYQYNDTTLRLETEALAFDTDADGVIDFTPTVQRGTDTLGRPSTLALAEGEITRHSQTTRYWGASRVKGIDVVGLPDMNGTDLVTFLYYYRDDLPGSAQLMTSPVHLQRTTLEDDRPAISSVTATRRTGNLLLSSYTYAVNDLGQRESVTTSGSAMSAATTAWHYDALGQLTAEDFGNNESPDDRDRGYSFDLIGNREHSIQGNTDPLAAGNLTYDANPLNQYEFIDSFSPVHDDDGNLTTGRLHSAALTSLTGLTGTPYTATLAWNGENRLTEVKDGTTVKAAYQYDPMGRRVRKQLGTAVTHYVYDGWNLLGEFTQNGTDAPVIQRTYTWGLDLSGTPQGAGGVGGLLAVKQGSAVHYPTYDGNGNVSEYLTSGGNVAAHFEYDGFGNTVINTDTSGNFPFRFSTKPLEDVTGLYYYGYRYYDPITGRWPSRDPIEERGGLNLYSFVENDGVTKWDYLGLVIDAENIEDGDSCSKNCKTCDSDGTLKIRNNGTQGSNVKAIAFGRTFKSRYIKDASENCEDECCARTWYWFDCYSGDSHPKAGEEFNETITPAPPGEENGSSNGGPGALSLQIQKQKVCRCEKGVWRCHTAVASTNGLLYKYFDRKDYTKGWKFSNSF